MRNYAATLIAGIGIASLIAGVITSLAVAPFLSNRGAWLRNTILSSFLITLGGFVFLFTQELKDQPVFDFQSAWYAISPLLPAFLVFAILFAAGNYYKAWSAEKFSGIRRWLATKLSAKKK